MHQLSDIIFSNIDIDLLAVIVTFFLFFMQFDIKSLIFTVILEYFEMCDLWNIQVQNQRDLVVLILTYNLFILYFIAFSFKKDSLVPIQTFLMS